MGSITYKQYDKRWGSKNYNGSSTMATAGCGPTSCATVISAHNPKITPIDTMNFMKKHGYAIYGNGTAWAGIPACLKWGGLKDVHEVTTMDALWKCMAKKGYRVVILFHDGKRGGVVWTTSGHFVPATAYKRKNGKHYLWMRDPGPRNKEGWYCYEDKMRGLIRKMWVGKLPEAETKKPAEKKPAAETKVVTVKRKKTDILADFAEKTAWPYGTKKKVYKYPSGKRKQAYIKALNKAYPNRSGWRRQTRMGASCDVYVGTCVRASGIDKKFPRGCDDILKYMKTDHAKKKWKTLKASSWKEIPRGCVVFQIKKTGAKHITIKLKGNRLANAHYCQKTYPIIEKASSRIWSKGRCRTFKVYKPK